MTTIKCDASIVLDTRQSAEMWCTYEHQAVLNPAEPPEVVLVGASRLVDVFRLLDGRSNSEWTNIFRNGGQVLLRIIAVTPSKAEARRLANEHMRAMRPMPRCNLIGHNLRGNVRAIYCINNKKTYHSQREAANDLGLHGSAISRHMRGELAHASGYKFIYASELDDGALPAGVGEGM